MRVTRVLIEGFRGWGHLDVRPGSHVLVAGVPRAGRTDLITALARVLHPDSARGAALSDLHQRRVILDGADPAPAEAVGDVAEGQPEAVVGAPAVVGTHDAASEDASDDSAASQARSAELQRVEAAQVEVTLTDLDPDVQQLLDGVLEPLEDSGCASEDPDASEDAPLCARLAYRLSYDEEAEALESVVYFPARSNPALGQYSRVPAATRRMLPVVTLDAGQPLQLRAGAGLRRILDERDAKAGAAAFDALAQAVTEAVSALSADPAVAEAVNAILAVGGTGERIADTALTAEQVGFRTEDGSVAGLLRTLRAALHLDAGGLLGLAQHGSTVSAVLSMAEAMLLATVPGAVVLADDFGDQLDAPATEHLAALLRARSGQVWLSTRRPEAARAFEPTEVLRLVRHGGVRSHHQLTKITDRKALVAMRQWHTQLLAALTAPTVAITEGPHDVAVLSMVDRRRPPSSLPLSAHGVRLVASGTGGEGGISQIPRIANLARQLGFRVLAVIDRDKDSAQTTGELTKILAACDAVVRLPPGAIEQAVTAGLPLQALADASATLTEYGIPDPMGGQLTEAAVTNLCKVIHKQGLHEQFLEALYAEPNAPHPPVVSVTLALMELAADSSYNGQQLIDVPTVSRPAGA
ncbi:MULTISPECIES: hypothetical protein [Streptomyces]|uniref:hypothetical protein n=1 Tax=Streptomyces TaxID=1883 RepID=UPI001A954A6A|nr:MULTISPECIES: hypothetical protein [Streptomyces]MBT3078331.1 hypothetical protein [Streptomyces sp. COG21]MBT3080272.1 hypothetical protein [Streptomyces sp. COG20]MBT3087311.1 hypothetical protein [Streptomyces sp. CYG21]MBT3097675.1 hypothetical protein [Streptomyces sp. CBG30]MBT3104992.1 hypothetical protein [Streptomyces sp. COG19]